MGSKAVLSVQIGIGSSSHVFESPAVIVSVPSLTLICQYISVEDSCDVSVKQKEGKSEIRRHKVNINGVQSSFVSANRYWL